MTTSTTDSSATSSSEKRWSSWVALKRSSLRWIGLQAKTTVILPQKKKLTSTVATGGFARTWWISMRCRQGVSLTSRKHCRHCTAKRKRRTRNTRKIGHKVPPHGGNGKRTGGNPIMRIHHKDGVTTDWTGKPVYSVGNYSFAVWISARIECKIYREYISVTADSSLLSPTEGVNRIPPDTAIHEQMATINGYVKVCTTTSTPSTTVRPLWTITWMTRRTWTCAICRTEHTCTLSVVALSNHSSHHMAQAARTCLS